jgi:hypothetical protein
MKNLVLLFAACILFVWTANAQTVTPKVNKRQQIQKERIHNGIQNGELTRKETRLLAKEQRHIKRSERRAKSDGIVTKRERARLDRKQDRANRHIGRAKHNRMDRN